MVDVLDQVELPPDFVLRELHDLVPSNSDDIIAITAHWGLAAPWAPRTFDYLDGGVPETLTREVQAWAQLRRPLVHPVAVDIHLRVLRTLSRHLLAYLEEKGDEAVMAAWEPEGPAVPRSIEEAWSWWEGYLNRGLAAFTVHVRLHPDREAALLSRPLPNLYNAGCLQLAQYLSSELTVKRCANERCRKPFTVQRGRAREDYGQHRSRGVRYCSHLCAKAQSARDQRAQRRKEKKS